MKVLVIFSNNFYREIRPFISEQVENLSNLGVDLQYYPLNKNGITGYLSFLFKLVKKIKKDKIDIIHAHYGLLGTLACMQRRIPVVITYHGSDINYFKIKVISYIGMVLSKANIFVSDKLCPHFVKNKYIIPCGVDFDKFYPISKIEARDLLGISKEKKIVLFSSFFSNPEKNYELAEEAISLLNDVVLFELKGYKRNEVNLLLNACDCLLLTSIKEGSPQLIKEAMACNCPIVSTNVGDVKITISDTFNCYIVNFDPFLISDTIKKVISANLRTNGRNKINHLNNKIIAKKVLNVYSSVIKNKRKYNV